MVFTLFGLGMLVLLIVAAAIIFERHKSSNPQSKSYRKYLTNMYVSAKVRSLASKDDLNLTDEEKNFTEYIALSNKEMITSLDEKIEADLMERVEDKKGDKK